MMLRFVRVLFPIVLGSAIAAHQSCGDVLYTKANETISGRIDRQTDTHVFFRQRVAPDEYRERTFALDEVLTIVETIDSDRLTGLKPSEPEQYRLYAEELATRTRDAEALDLALRLYLIAAYRGEGELRRSAFLGMIQVARSEMEKNRIHRLAFQVLGQWPAESGGRSNQVTATGNEGRGVVDDLLSAIRSLREHRHVEAADTINDPDVREALDKYQHICSWQDLRQWSLGGRLSQSSLSKLLQLEIAITADSRSVILSNVAAPAEDSWLAAIRRSREPASLVTFFNVCEFSPTDSIYRNGVWTSEED